MAELFARQGRWRRQWPHRTSCAAPRQRPRGRLTRPRRRAMEARLAELEGAARRGPAPPPSARSREPQLSRTHRGRKGIGSCRDRSAASFAGDRQRSRFVSGQVIYAEGGGPDRGGAGPLGGAVDGGWEHPRVRPPSRGARLPGRTASAMRSVLPGARGGAGRRGHGLRRQRRHSARARGGPARVFLTAEGTCAVVALSVGSGSPAEGCETRVTVDTTARSDRPLRIPPPS